MHTILKQPTHTHIFFFFFFFFRKQDITLQLYRYEATKSEAFRIFSRLFSHSIIVSLARHFDATSVIMASHSCKTARWILTGALPSPRQLKAFKTDRLHKSTMWAGVAQREGRRFDPLRLSFLFRICGLWTLSCDFAHICKHNWWNSQMAHTTVHLNAESLWWWQCNE